MSKIEKQNLYRPKREKARYVPEEGQRRKSSKRAALDRATRPVEDDYAE